jgi:hypothetical protein
MDYSLLMGVHYFSEDSARALKQKAQQVCALLGGQCDVIGEKTQYAPAPFIGQWLYST